MKRITGLTWLLLSLSAAVATAGPTALDVDAPGGLTYEKDGSFKALGTDGKPVVAATGEYEISARSLHYDPRRATGTAAGGVRWRGRRADRAYEIKADAITFALAAKTLRAEGMVELNDRGLNLQADSLAADLAAGLYTVSGKPARAGYDSHQIQAQSLVYSQVDTRTLTAAGGLTWRMWINGKTCQIAADNLTYDLTARRGAAAGGVRIEAGDTWAAGEHLSYENDADRIAISGEPAVVRGELKLKAAYLAWQPGAGLVVATGHAEFSDPTFTGSGDELRYVAGENRIYLTGAVRLTRGRDILTGAEVVCDLDTGQVRVAGGAKAVLEG